MNKTPEAVYEDKIYNLIMSQELTWEGLIRDIVKEDNMSPWDIDISRLSNRFVELIQDMDLLNFHVTGKFLLTATILLKMKSEYLTVEDLMMHPNYYLSDLANAIDLNFVFDDRIEGVPDDFKIIPRMNPPRKRKVTLDELVDSLHKALKVVERRENRYLRREKVYKMRNKFVKVNIQAKIKNVYSKIKEFFSKFGKEEVTFSNLTPSKQRKDIIWTFIPILHLSNDNKIDLEQEESFSEIKIKQHKRKSND